MNGKIKSRFEGWKAAAKKLETISKESESDEWLNNGQRNAIAAIIKRIPANGVLIADEVGMGKTRIAVAVARAVTQAQGRVAILIPAGLGYQWKEELRTGKLPDVPDPVRSLDNYFNDTNRNFFNEPIVLISHLFSNWRHRENSNSSRFAFLPEMYACLRNEKNRLPRNYKLWSDENSTDTMRTKAQHIVQAIPKDPKNPARIKLSCLNDFKWDRDLFRKNRYIDSTDEKLKTQLNACVGVGLGIFDLIIIDEAHKNRKVESGLSKLLYNIICRDANHRVLGLTATPVELEPGDWLSTLKRIGVTEENLIEESISRYAKAVKDVRGSWRLSAIDRENFKTASKHFEKLLKKYLIRRDKREDAEINDFQKKSGRPYSQYREEKEISIDPGEFGFPTSWRKAICGAEALSFVSAFKDSSWLKRQRLTLANGHGISAWLDITNQVEDDMEQENVKGEFSTPEPVRKYSNLEKKQQRIANWKKLISNAVPSTTNPLFKHPAILATIECIEAEYTKFNQKVLVFGKFTRPMKALVALLNAREMIRRLDRGQSWPQYQLNREELVAVAASLKELNNELRKTWEISQIKSELKKNEYKIEASRKKFRKYFLPTLRDAFSKQQSSKKTLAFRMFEMIEATPKKYESLFLHLSRACYELLFGTELTKGKLADPIELMDKYNELILALTDVDMEEEDSHQDFQPEELEDILYNLLERLKEEFGSQSARFARFMYGETPHHARRLMQLAFNRPGSFPFVLVAQSQVGREGLNLHKACKTVIMLHPEWNPGVAEQQIGRVDRVGSLWAEMIKNYHGNGKDIPRIEVRPVIFKNTYDEQNWNVLKERWDDLRAQLHGIIIPDRILKEATQEDKDLIKELNDHAPDFRPE